MAKWTTFKFWVWCFIAINHLTLPQSCLPLLIRRTGWLDFCLMRLLETEKGLKVQVQRRGLPEPGDTFENLSDLLRRSNAFLKASEIKEYTYSAGTGCNTWVRSQIKPKGSYSLSLFDHSCNVSTIRSLLCHRLLEMALRHCFSRELPVLYSVLFVHFRKR